MRVGIIHILQDMSVTLAILLFSFLFYTFKMTCWHELFLQVAIEARMYWKTFCMLF